MTIFYFTSTGNCLYAAKRIGARQVSVVQAMKNGEKEFADDAIGLVFPVYGLCVPPVIREFLATAAFKCDYLFAVITFGTFDAASASQLAELANKSGKTFDYINTLNMAENYLPGFDMAKEKKKERFAEEKALVQIAEDIAARKKWTKKNGGLERFLTWTHVKSYHFNIGAGMTEQFTIADSCLGCGICAQVCPRDNIKIVNKKPVFDRDCASCLACAQNCPHNAIRLKNEKSAERYRNPNITLDEIIQANK